ncbi:MAG: multiheme c-type cytochrome [Desulfuromonadaceae bacterium]|nr:multiheme c-type cytochrome [Desulfuromonadaceae bacterium]
MKRTLLLVGIACVGLILNVGLALANNSCIDCHSKNSPGQVMDWEASRHSQVGITCDVCHGNAHKKANDYQKAILPDETKCAQCHRKQFTEFTKGKHNHGWSVLSFPALNGGACRASGQS